MGAVRRCQWLLIGIVLVVSSSRATSQTEIAGTNLSKREPIFNPGYVETRNDDANQTDLALSSARRRRYVRFPTGSAGYLFEGGGPPIGRNIGVHPGLRFPSWRQHKSVWRSPVAEYNRPVMGHRTPRLIFRDNDFPSPVGGSAPSFFQQSNHLPDFEDDGRGNLVLVTRRFVRTRLGRFVGILLGDNSYHELGKRERWKEEVFRY